MKCELENLSVYYEIHGEGKPILMIHGFELDHRVMKGCMEPIFEHKEDYQRIYFDLPGMGQTEGKNWIKNSDQMLEITLQFVEATIPNKSFLVVGESYGAYIARGVIYKKFDFVEGACFICPLIIPEPSKRNLPEKSIIVKNPEFLSGLNPKDAEDFNYFSVVQTKEVWERYKEEIFSASRIADEKFLEEIWEKGYPFTFKVDKKIKEFEKPSLFLLGRQDSAVGYKDAWNIIEKYPRSTFAIIDKAGHSLQIENVELFNSLVSEWLTRIEEFG